ncbi:MAG: YqgE/AlgH family protein [Verrucomicrobia bacterium]|nr:MAG: YqgE/AlgH family protein [Verrucomicrobiota bacterium]PYL00615.1 MAG: YqgE/AlgH family protein [Verrucomicrobiota bacterium]
MLLDKNVRELSQNKEKSYAGSLLVAHPNMLDPNFRRAVLFLSAHTPDDGALGVILNRPLEKRVSEVVSEAPLNALDKVPVFFGGPVGRDRLIFASLEWKSGEGLKLNHNVDMDEANKQIGKNPGSVRAFIGYAGWGAGQLEAEMKQNAWVIRKPDRATMKLDRLPRLWFDIMSGLGPWFKLLAAAPDDPSLN